MRVWYIFTFWCFVKECRKFREMCAQQEGKTLRIETRLRKVKYLWIIKMKRIVLYRGMKPSYGRNHKQSPNNRERSSSGQPRLGVISVIGEHRYQDRASACVSWGQLGVWTIWECSIPSAISAVRKVRWRAEGRDASLTCQHSAQPA